MSLIKNFLFNEINSREEVDTIDADYDYQLYLQKQEALIDEAAEKDSFLRIGELTGTYPM